ncbi:MAG: DinB family protein [SAR324 cluster bacterium]|nr:DinB family protein [SAR324 cluster bacterium]
MSSPYLAQAQFNRAINEAWLKVLAEVPFAELDADQGAFFGSIFGTLNHILLADRIWISRILGEPFTFNKLSDRLCGSLESLAVERKLTDEVLIDLMEGEQNFGREIAYTNSSGAPFSQPLQQILIHLFAQQHHHRGQISQMCHERGIPIPDGGTIAYTRKPQS